MAEVFFGLGSNLGEKSENIRSALDLLSARCSMVRVSSLYLTEPMGVRDQDWFLNCAAEATTNLEPGELLSLIQSIESKLGRAPAVPNGPRTIDVDILFYGSQIIEQDGLTIPHPRLHERSFVLAPLAEIRPYFPHPVLARTVTQLLSSLTEPGKWERVEEPPLHPGSLPAS